MKRLYWTQPDMLEADVVVTALEGNRVATDPVLFHPARPTAISAEL
ncbi:hypothetical protein [Anaerobaca lacustris]|uniref:Uncharacterized protein n=1 Tax=Anaerobaca lacustris TaxID=3044600 RepID=A0AAW6U828_9BACT|nr:hypothetical protein [Sedimentisphaerales bacterium M17dextr]